MPRKYLKLTLLFQFCHSNVECEMSRSKFTFLMWNSMCQMPYVMVTACYAVKCCQINIYIIHWYSKCFICSRPQLSTEARSHLVVILPYGSNWELEKEHWINMNGWGQGNITIAIWWFTWQLKSLTTGTACYKVGKAQKHIANGSIWRHIVAIP